MTKRAQLGKQLAAGVKAAFSTLLYVAPPIFFGWQKMSVLAPILWRAFLAVLAFFSEYRLSPDYVEWKSRPIAFAIALVAFLLIYYVARWLSPN